MNHFRQGRGWLVLVPVVALFVSPAVAQSVTNAVASPASARLSVMSAIMPPPIPPSPVDYFRKLLTMSPQQLQSVLANKPPKIRARILAKVSEYAALDADDRELRLRATELRWYLTPLLQVPPDRRPTQLGLVPADIRDLVQARLMEWDILPPPLKQEFLDNEHIAGYFAGLSITNGGMEASVPSGPEQSRWNAYSETERQAMISQFDAFFNLSPVEKQRALGELTDTERKQMQATLQTFSKLPIRQRIECIRAFSKFAEMSPEERAQFLKNAARWSKMTPSERRAWRDLVAHVPQWPPIPTAEIAPPVPLDLMPPTIPPRPYNVRTVADTNHT